MRCIREGTVQFHVDAFAHEFFESFTKVCEIFKKLGRRETFPERAAAAAVLESTGPSFKEIENGQNPLGFG